MPAGVRSPAAPHRRARGLTLVELLVVCAIMSILLALLTTSLGEARESARMVKCGSNLAQIVKAGHAYAADCNGKWPLPPFYESNNALWLTSPPMYVHYGVMHNTYLAGGGYEFYCPSATLITAKSAEYGVKNLGVPGRVAVSPYFMRGVPEGAPRSTIAHPGLALLSDMIGVRGVPPNHGQRIMVAHLDGSVTRYKVHESWASDTFYSHGEDSLPGAADGAWSHLDQRQPRERE